MTRNYDARCEGHARWGAKRPKLERLGRDWARRHVRYGDASVPPPTVGNQIHDAAALNYWRETAGAIKRGAA